MSTLLKEYIKTCKMHPEVNFLYHVLSVAMTNYILIDEETKKR